MCRAMCAQILTFLILFSSLQSLLSLQCSRNLKVQHASIRYQSKGRIARFRCQSGYVLVGEKASVCRRSVWSELPRCVGTNCRPIKDLENMLIYETHQGGVYTLFCHSKYEIKGSNKLYCNGTHWEPEMPHCINREHGPDRQCDFETGLCGFTNDPNHDFDWVRENAKTPLRHVHSGPKYDHTLGENANGSHPGYYMYIESESRLENDTARLFSPIYNQTQTPFCINFFYHMFGFGTGTLNVYVKPTSTILNNLKPVFQKTGSQGNLWYEGRVLINFTSSEFQIIFEGVHGSNMMSNIAIDDFKILDHCKQTITPQPTLITKDATTASALDLTCENKCGTWGKFCNCSDNCIDEGSCCADFYYFCSTNTGINNFQSVTTTTTRKTTIKTIPLKQQSIVSRKEGSISQQTVLTSSTESLLIIIAFSSCVIISILIVIKRLRFGSFYNKNSCSSSDSISDVRFLTSDEQLNFQLPYDN